MPIGQSIGGVLGKPGSRSTFAKTDLLVDSTTLLGVEIEVENFGSKSLDMTKGHASYWKHEEDHSLRNNGREFVFAEPLFGLDVVNALNWLCSHAKENKYAISSRTGLHVHTDVRSLSIPAMKNMCILNALVEPLIYNWVGGGRDKNIFCLPWFMAEADISVIGKSLQFCMDPKMNPAMARDQFAKVNRYAGFNMAALTKYGTIEWRHLRTTFDFNRILDWINIILSVKKYAEDWTVKGGEGSTLIERMKFLGPKGFGNEVFGSKINDMWYPEFAYEYVGKSISVADELLTCCGDMSRAQHDPVTVAHKFAKALKSAVDEEGDSEGFLKWSAKTKPKNQSTDPPPMTVTMEEIYMDEFDDLLPEPEPEEDGDGG